MKRPKLTEDGKTDISHMSILEIIGYVYKKLNKQKWVRSLGLGRNHVYDSCAFRSPEGLRCAAGHLFCGTTLDAIEAAGYMNSNVDTVIQEKFLILPEGKEFEYGGVIKDLQLAHDTVFSSNDKLDRKERKQYFLKIASHHGFVPAKKVKNVKPKAR